MLNVPSQLALPIYNIAFGVNAVLLGIALAIPRIVDAFFDASINRIAAWVVGTRSALKCLLMALLEPHDKISGLERQGDYTARLMLMEEIKTLPIGSVWEEYCRRAEVPSGEALLKEIKNYEHQVLAKR